MNVRSYIRGAFRGCAGLLLAASTVSAQAPLPADSSRAPADRLTEERVRAFLVDLREYLARDYLPPALEPGKAFSLEQISEDWRARLAILRRRNERQRDAEGAVRIVQKQEPNFSVLAALDIMAANWRLAAADRSAFFTDPYGGGSGTGIELLADLGAQAVEQGMFADEWSRLGGQMRRTAAEALMRGAPARDLDRLASLPAPQHDWVTWHAMRGTFLDLVGARMEAVMALARHDTATALERFLVVATRGPTPYRQDGLPAAYQALALARARPGSWAHLRALTVAYLQYSFRAVGTRDGDKQAFLAELEQVYPRYLRAYGVPPDVKDAAHPMARSDKPLALEDWLDRQWSVLMDREFATVPFVPSATIPASGRLVVGERVSGIDCGGCFFHDRVASGLERRYAPGQLLALSFTGFSEAPDGIAVDELRTVVHEWYEFSGKTPAIPRRWFMTTDGQKSALNSSFYVNGYGFAVQPEEEHRARIIFANSTYGELTLLEAERTRRVTDSLLAVPPQARVRARAHWRGDTAFVTVDVDSVQGSHPRAALRIALFTDTIRIRGGTPRRMHYNLVWDVASSPTLRLGVPIALDRPTTTTYAFDVARLQAKLSEQQRQAGQKAWSAKRWFDPRDWQLPRERLHVVAYVQDLDTGDILQASRTPVEGSPAPRK